ncbi:fimbrial protein [Photorhabdus aegyptia]|uniref:P pilus assembly protein, pilin FimA n=1 Tax=Photorhabdus aegyptia TaxID=2805098 RepID=A0A022PJ88_9GAMM|nr:type 1 fimbrial protein [Photorhabdus aegyptia]EYU14993.1 P pilus assembly protein, pilin FimA [Photorhabdus aegyptia]
MKKQMMKTSVLAAVLLSMGMGMAHASGGATVNVLATIGASTCDLNVTGTDIAGNNGSYTLDMGTVTQSNIGTDIATAHSLGKDLEVKLANCSNKMGNVTNSTKFTPSQDIQVQVLGQTLTGNDKIFNANAKADVGVAVYDTTNNAMTKATPIIIAADAKEFDPASPTDGEGMKKFKVALVSKSKTTVPAAQEVIAPVTFQVVYK